MIFHCASSAQIEREKFYVRQRTQSSQYDAGGAPVRDPGSTGMNQGSTRMNWGSIGDDRDEPGKTRAPPGKTGNDRRGTGNNRDGTGNNRDGTVAPPGPIQIPAELRQRPGECR
ncbi:hypothetical protein DPMN_174135 [Dreissena polymorpha]|uniref:Uncharacterized protein n=1 Tax=Dreissena polymorpha TaxID=45954 RepID=A0A9D4IGU4_DREPO|nr:hypothetical protein DPMN_174135 [Dreissena polymorpha]